jgi:hypothetical protein
MNNVHKKVFGASLVHDKLLFKVGLRLTLNIEPMPALPFMLNRIVVVCHTETANLKPVHL